MCEDVMALRTQWIRGSPTDRFSGIENCKHGTESKRVCQYMVGRWERCFILLQTAGLDGFHLNHRIPNLINVITLTTSCDFEAYVPERRTGDYPISFQISQ